jgi:hypothetical protein
MIILNHAVISAIDVEIMDEMEKIAPYTIQVAKNEGF